jgi:large subunit ribosomal protein L10
VPRPDKVAAVDEVKQNLSDAAATLLTDYRGLTVTELAELRAELRKNNATYKVVKNTLTRFAATEAGIEGLDEYLVGPTALVFCGDDPVGPAKVLKAFQKDHPALIVKAGYLDGQVLDTDATLKLAELESREELLAKLAGMMNTALAGVARLMQAAVVDMGRLMKALEDDGGVEAKGFSPSAPAEEPAAEEEAPAEAATDEAAVEAEATTDEPEAEAADDTATDAADEAEAEAAEATDEPEAAATDDDESSDDTSDDSSDDA